MENLKESISIKTCTLGSKVPNAVYINVNQETLCFEKDSLESISFCRTHILNNILNLKQFKIKIL